MFEDRAVSWVDSEHKSHVHSKNTAILILIATVFVAELNRGRPLLSPAPPQVLDHLRACRPHEVHERAWLVMYYGIILSMVSSTDPMDKSTKVKLQCNLWLALNDVRLFLEPSEPNIQALILLACHVEEFTTPSLCWMLVTNACRMLQALGVSHRRSDTQTRERRVMIFWHLNLLDKGMALIFGRPPTFYRAMARDIALPTLNQLLPFQPHITSAGAPALFGTHFIHQMMLASLIMADIWNCLYEEDSPSESRIASVREDLELWYRQAQEVGRDPTTGLTTCS